MHTQPIQKKTRSIWADIIRILAILFVIIVHTFTLSNGNTISALLSLHVFVLAKTCIPLFIMLSGALLLPKVEPSSVFLRKRIQRVVLPWITWTIVFSLCIYVAQPVALLQIFSLLRDVFSGYFTFLPLIFCLYLLIPTLRIIARGSSTKHLWYLIVVWFSATSLLPYMRNTLAFPLIVDNGLVTQTIRYVGYLLLGYVLSEKQNQKNAKFFLISTIISTTLLTAWLMRQGESLQHIYSAYSSPLIVLGSSALFLLVRNSSPYVETFSRTAKNSIHILSQASFGVFLIHGGVIQASSLFLPQTNNLLRFSLVTFVSFSTILLLMSLKRIRSFVT